MSRVAPEIDPDELPDPICNYCGSVIEETDQECPGRPQGVCAP